MSDLKRFWNDRAVKYGHTGWADNFIYAYDQQARIIAIESIINSLNIGRQCALDFGCGSGDFSSLLSKYFNNVISIDISEKIIDIAKQKYKNLKNISFVKGDIKELEISPNSIGLILSITVLNHIKDDDELAKVLRYFSMALKRDGVLITLEYMPDWENENNVIISSYLRFTGLNEWLSLFSQNNFYLDKYYNFYHPIEKPCNSYLSYKKNVTKLKGGVLKCINLIDRKSIDIYLEKLAKNELIHKDFIWNKGENDSPVKIMILRKK